MNFDFHELFIVNHANNLLMMFNVVINSSKQHKNWEFLMCENEGFVEDNGSNKKNICRWESKCMIN
jgi:hypothetical protein